jgi:type I restriction enzyme, S subunit
MRPLQKVKIESFLFERNGRYKPEDRTVSNLKRIEKIDFAGKFYLSNKPSRTNMILVKSGDLVISGINVTKGAMGIYEGADDIAATIHYSSYTFDKNIINIEYFKRFLKTNIFLNLLKKQVKGGIKTEIKPKHILPLELFIPDISEQEEIVEHLRGFEDEANSLFTETSRQQALLKMLHQSILQDAIFGKLTEQRGEENDVESAAELLARIKEDKGRLIKEGKIKKQKLLPPITDDEIPFELAEGWSWCRLGDIIYEDPRNGYSPNTVDFVTKVKTLKLGATTTGIFVDSEFKYINEHIESDSFLWLKPGDILIQRGNSIDYVGVSAIFDGPVGEFIYPDLMMKIQPHREINGIYLHIVLLSSFVRGYFRSNASGAQKTMPKINQKTVAKTLIPLPPKQEVAIILLKLKPIIAYCLDLKKQNFKSRQDSMLLVKAALNEAFEMR